MRHFSRIRLSKKVLKLADKSIRLILVGLLILSILSIVVLMNVENQQSSDNKEIISITQINENSQNTRSQLGLSGTGPPIVTTSPDPIPYFEGDLFAYKLKWKVESDPIGTEDQYVIYRNDQHHQNGTYTGGPGPNFITVDVDQMERGFYNYTIVANDTDGYFVTDTEYVTVTDNANPVFISTQSDFNISEGSSGNNIIWSATELHPLNYSIFRNEIEVKNGTWNSDEDVLYDIDGLPFGEHNFNVTIFDDSGNSASHTLTIHVTDEDSPIILSYPMNITFPYTTQGNNLILNATDSHPDSYQIFEDGVLVNNGTWSNEELITWNLDYLIQGNYTFSIFLVDQYSNNNTYYIDVFVILLKETSIPLFTITSNVYEGDYETIYSLWEDVYEEGIENANVTISLISSGEVLDTTYLFGISDINGEFDLNLNYTGIAYGDYQWNIVFEAENFVSQEITLDFIVIPHFYEITVSELTDLTQGEMYHITATIVYKNPPSGLNLDALTGRSGPVSNVEVDLFMTTTLTDGNLWNISKNSVSNENGELDFVLTILETSLLSSVNSLSLESVGNEFGNSIIIMVPIDDFPLILTPDGIIITSDTNTSSDKTVSELLNDPNTILLVLTVLFLFLLLLIFRRIRKKNALKNLDFQGELNIALAEIKGLSSLQLVTLTSNTGIPLYERKLKSLGINSILLSGVTSAISALLQEANDQQIFGLEIMENQGLSITSHKAKNSSLVFISSTSLPLLLLNQMIDTHEKMESKYGDKLISGVGNIFNDDEMYELFDEAALKLGLAGELNIDLNKLESFTSNVKKKNGESSFVNTLLDISKEGVKLFDANSLLNILQERGFPENQAAKYILKAYEDGIIS